MGILLARSWRIFITISLLFLLTLFHSLHGGKACQDIGLDGRFRELDNSSSEVHLLWEVELNNMTISTPVAGDVNNDGKVEVIVYTTHGYLYCIDGTNGNILWSDKLEGGIFLPGLCDVDNDDIPEIITASDNTVYCIDGSDGSEQWECRINAGISSWTGFMSVMRDLDSDGNVEIIVDGYSTRYNYEYGPLTVYCIGGSNGSIKWNTTLGNISLYTSRRIFIATGDANHDGCLDILLSVNDLVNDTDPHKLFCLNGRDGSILWDKATELQYQSILLYDMNNDGFPEIYMAGENSRTIVECINLSNGEDIWHVAAPGTYLSAPLAIGDLYGKGSQDLIIPADYCLIRINPNNGNILGIYYSSCIVSHFLSVALADMEYDGKLEIVGCSCVIYCFDPIDNKVLWKYSTKSPMSLYNRLLLYDVDKDSSIEVIACDQRGDVLCLDPEHSGSRIYWQVCGAINGFPATSNVLDVDKDLDCLSDYSEISYGTDPSRPDTDGDGAPDGWEIHHRLDPLVADSDEDNDCDGLNNLDEYLYGSDPNNADTDGDGMVDSWEVMYGLNPTKNDAYEDPNEDGLSNIDEYFIGTYPNDSDTDNDMFNDGLEYRLNTDPIKWYISPFTVYCVPVLLFPIVLHVDRKRELSGGK